jgi:hypothetical protein
VSSTTKRRKNGAERSKRGRKPNKARAPRKDHVEKYTVCRVDYTFDEDRDDAEKKIKDYALSLDSENVNVRLTGGGPCWNTYFLFQSASPELAELAAKSLEKYIRRFKGARILD